ncbi:integral membrane protein [Streptomyces lincolnensis]|uniref:Integral membrane protein n=1 Tax=Streptomyces lincolnensis TaxID=1915 RepID=A0A1B1MJG9_STRLN|nr:ABC transporter [Streptomyces lincolnensis]ANS68677.1 integral membrane protein [Streptomyces lincolnensis]AXG53118.1 integral membrane protein [Streptomyces lincolnensis]QMV10291.1 ABC transporter [Streptomyces lincolnensis]
MTALLRYQTALLLRSQRWLPPFILYVVFLGVGVQGGQPVLDSLGYAAAALLPVAAWLVRIGVSGEPPAAQHCVASAVGPGRAHLARLLVALGGAAVLGTVATVVVTWISDPVSSDHQTRVPVLLAGAAGLLAALACALLGTAIGALTTWPVLRTTGRAVPALLLAALLSLVVSGSPAQAAVSGLVTGSLSGTVDLPVLPLAGAALLAAVATAAACALTARRSP